MKFITGIKNIDKKIKGCVLTIGNFDGIHIGHQKLLNTLFKEGKTRNLPSVVILFEPHPIKFLKKNNYIKQITGLRDKISYLSHIGIDIVICIRFNRYFSSYTPQKFIKILVAKLSFKLLVVGKDFRFGLNRTGNISFLQVASIQYGFDLIYEKTVFYKGKKISSTLIRKILLKGNLRTAKILLGHPFCISGRVIYGNSLGKKIGFPTANIALKKNIFSIQGVYAVKIYGFLKKPILGVANIGMRPTFSGKYQQCEVHLLEFKMDLYGSIITVVFYRKIRNEKKFNSLLELKKQITKDILITKKIFHLKK